jgi:hypothetical protein
MNVSTKQERIAELAKRSPQMAFTSLAYLMDIDWLKEAYRRTRKDGAVGVDGMTADEYEQHLEGNLQRLLDRAKSGAYCAPPVRRVHIPSSAYWMQRLRIRVPYASAKSLAARLFPICASCLAEMAQYDHIVIRQGCTVGDAHISGAANRPLAPPPSIQQFIQSEMLANWPSVSRVAG